MSELQQWFPVPNVSAMEMDDTYGVAKPNCISCSENLQHLDVPLESLGLKTHSHSKNYRLQFNPKYHTCWIKWLFCHIHESTWEVRRIPLLQCA